MRKTRKKREVRRGMTILSRTVNKPNFLETIHEKLGQCSALTELGSSSYINKPSSSLMKFGSYIYIYIYPFLIP